MMSTSSISIQALLAEPKTFLDRQFGGHSRFAAPLTGFRRLYCSLGRYGRILFLQAEKFFQRLLQNIPAFLFVK
jgi:hypothetical protein